MSMILSEEQNMLKDSARDFCGTNNPITQLRKLRDDADAYMIYGLCVASRK